MVEKRTGDIFFVCATASWQPFPVSPAYCAAKHGLLGLSRTLRDTTKDKGLRVVAVMPGKTLTPAWDGTEIPVEKFIPADDVANIILSIHQLDRRTNIDEIIVRPRESS
jgi:NADP-dependent 3-hydroxy acid dehydrogenase YdfG